MRLSAIRAAFVLVALPCVTTACGGRQGHVVVRDGVELARAGQRDAAKQRFERALKLAPSTPGARTGLAVLAADPERALKDLDKELGAHPTLPEARFDRARVLVGRGAAADAERALADLEGLPSDPEVERLRELATFLAGKAVAVPAGLEAVTTSHVGLVAAWEALAKAAPGEPIAVPEGALAFAPRLAAALHAREGRWAEALAALPTTPETALDRATCLAWLDRLDEARALVTEVLRATPDDPRASALAAALE